MKLKVRLKGSASSGHYGHAGRPGKVGGSQPKGIGDNPVTADEVPDVIPTPVRDVGLWLIGVDKDTDERKLVTGKGNEAWHHERLAKFHNLWLADIWPRGLAFEYEGKPIILMYDFNDFTPQEDLVAETLSVYDDIINQLDITGRRPLLMVSYNAGLSAKKLRPEVFKQLPIDDEAKRKLFQVRLEIFYDSSDSLAEQVFTGSISIADWETQMRSMVKEIHTSAAAIGKGGWDQMSFQEWGRLGTPLRQQYKWLHGFAQDIADQMDDISVGAIRSRARMYGRAAGYVASLMQAPKEILSQLPWIPKDGSTECLSNCRCVWLLKVIDKIKAIQTVQATWWMREAEHCSDCPERNGHVETFEVDADVQVPAMIGGF